MRFKTDDREHNIYDFEKAYKNLEIGKVKDKDVYAMVPVEFSYRNSNAEGLEVYRYAPVKNEKELEKFLSVLKKRIKKADAIKDLKDIMETSKGLIALCKLDTIKTRAFVIEKDTRSAFEKASDEIKEFFGIGKKSSKGEKLYLDSVKDLEKLDWYSLMKDFKEKERVFFIDTEPEELTKTAEAEKEAERERADREAEKAKEASIKRKSYKELTLSIIGTSIVVTGNERTIEAMRNNAKEAGVSSKNIGVSEKIVPENKKIETSKVPTVSKSGGKKSVRNALSRVKNDRGGRN